MNQQHTLVRPEDPGDLEAIRTVNEAAFGRSAEADLVAGLRLEGAVLASLVAVRGSRLVGHILFSRMWIETEDQAIPSVALAPVAVLPTYQRLGIGGRMIRLGLDRLRAGGERIVCVVGHPSYYPRFGFSSDRARAIGSPFPAGAFMMLELAPGALDGIKGGVRYAKAFAL